MFVTLDLVTPRIFLGLKNVCKYQPCHGFLGPINSDFCMYKILDFMVWHVFILFSFALLGPTPFSVTGAKFNC